MKRESEFFIAVYTNECKSYCDERFYKRLREITDGRDCQVHIVDNSLDESYFKKLQKMMIELEFTCPVKVEHTKVSRDDSRTLFLRNVTDSLKILQDAFLKSDNQFFLILESDVYPKNDDLLECFLEVSRQADIIGGIYYSGFQTPEDFQPESKSLIKKAHILSGCTLYKRKVLERFKFRWSYDNLGAFPDAWMSHDAGKCYILADYQKIKCDHMTKPSGSRGQEDLI